MSNDWAKDIHNMHEHYGFHKAVEKLSAKQMIEYFEFRVKFLEEELNELKSATNPDDARDARSDLGVVASGTREPRCGSTLNVVAIHVAQISTVAANTQPR